jgi:hypothetical protein
MLKAQLRRPTTTTATLKRVKNYGELQSNSIMNRKVRNFALVAECARRFARRV